MKADYWTKGKYFDEASFTSEKGKNVAFYSVDAQLIGTTTEIEPSAIPLLNLDKLKDKFKNYNIVRAVSFVDNPSFDTKMMLYDKSIGHEDKYFVELQNKQEELVIGVDKNGKTEEFSKTKIAATKTLN